MLQTAKNFINHLVFVIDMSGSMQKHKNAVIKVVDAQIKHLAQRSKELDQETRITVYVFNSRTTCLFYDMDVLRLPSIGDLYAPSGQTAMIDAIIKSQEDLAKTAQLYGDHAFLTYIFSDGENNQGNDRAKHLTELINNMPENWTVAFFAPNQVAKAEAKRFGVPADNIAIWDVSDSGSFAEVGEVVRTTSDMYMKSRADGVRGYRNLFSTGADAVNRDAVKANLKPLPRGSYVKFVVENTAQIRDYIEAQGYKYVLGNAYYQLTKNEAIQPQKKILVRNRRSGHIYSGDEARAMIGLPKDVEVRVKPDHNPDFDVLVQSTSVNRKLVPNTVLVYILP